MPHPPLTTSFGAKDRLPRQPEARRDVVPVGPQRAVVGRDVNLRQVHRRAGFDEQTDVEWREIRLEERRVGRHVEAGLRAQLCGDLGQVVVADAAVALGEVAEDVVAQAGVDGQPLADAPVVLEVDAVVGGEEVSPRVALVQVGSAAGRAVAVTNSTQLP